MAVRASRTSSSLNGLIIAITIFMGPIPAWARSRHDRAFSTEVHHAEKFHGAGTAIAHRIKCRARSPAPRKGLRTRGFSGFAGFGRNCAIRSRPKPSHVGLKRKHRQTVDIIMPMARAPRELRGYSGIVVRLLQGFAVLRDIETFQFMLARYAQGHERADDFEQDKRHAG